MDLYVLNTELETMGVIDSYESLIWTPRYFEPGDFEIYVRADDDILNLLIEDHYVMRFDSDMVGIIESVQITTDVDGGDYVTASGRCLKSILDRRIIWSQTNIRGSVEACIRSLIVQNVINPSVVARKINNFILGDVKNFVETMEAQYTGDNLLDAIIELCKSYGYGFKVVLTDDKKFKFDLYSGVNRSYSQDINPYVVFSSNFGNIVNSQYFTNKATLKNVCNVAGEGEGSARKTYTIGTLTDLQRRELFVDANDIRTEQNTTFIFNGNGSQKTFAFGRAVNSVSKIFIDGVEQTSSTYTTTTTSITFKVAPKKHTVINVNAAITITTAEYNNLLIERGKEKLSENLIAESFDGEVDSVNQYVYGDHYAEGDIVTIENKYGKRADPRILEVIESDDPSGHKIIPIFATWEVQ